MNRDQKHDHRTLLAVVCVAFLVVSGCRPAQAVLVEKNAPSRLEKIDGSDLSRVILTEQAAKRIDIQTLAIRTQDIDGVQRTVVPYAAVIYDVEGEAWVYTNPTPLTFVRSGIHVDTITGDMAVLLDGPPAGTTVVTVGGAELYGAEFEFQEG